jgi:hypothetical protein
MRNQFEDYSKSGWRFDSVRANDGFEFLRVVAVAEMILFKSKIIPLKGPTKTLRSILFPQSCRGSVLSLAL